MQGDHLIWWILTLGGGLAVLALTIYIPLFDFTRKRGTDLSADERRKWKWLFVVGIFTGALPLIGTAYVWVVMRPRRRLRP